MIVRLVPKRDPNVVIDRLWLVFFGEAEGNPWWSRFLPPGYRHVTACAWFDEQQRWVYFNPTRRGTVILLYREDEFGGRMQQLIDTSSCCLRVRSTLTRSSTPFGWWCTGAIKALIGMKSAAITPYQLSRALLRAGAEVVDLPCVGDQGTSIQSSADGKDQQSRSAGQGPEAILHGGTM